MRKEERLFKNRTILVMSIDKISHSFIKYNTKFLLIVYFNFLLIIKRNNIFYFLNSLYLINFNLPYHNFIMINAFLLIFPFPANSRIRSVFYGRPLDYFRMHYHFFSFNISNLHKEEVY